MRNILCCTLIAIVVILGNTVPSSIAADFEFCIAVGAGGSFELWAGGAAGSDHAGLAGFSVVLDGTVSEFHFDPIFVTLPGSPVVTAGFDERARGTLATQFHIYGAQTAIAPNTPIYDLTVSPQTIIGVSGPVLFGAPLRIGSGHFTGTPPMIDAAASACNAYSPVRDSSTFAALLSVGTCVCVGDLDGDGDIDITDLAIQLSNFGTPSGATYGQGDLDGDGDVDIGDLASLLAQFGSTC